MAYIKICDTPHGELGHDGWAWVIDHPYANGDEAHPAYYEDAGSLAAGANGHSVKFKRTYGPTRSGRDRNEDLVIEISQSEADAGIANRKEYDATHMLAGGWRVITD